MIVKNFHLTNQHKMTFNYACALMLAQSDFIIQAVSADSQSGSIKASNITNKNQWFLSTGQ